jgi:hypothetical protein
MQLSRSRQGHTITDLKPLLHEEGFAIIESLLAPGELAAWIEAVKAVAELEPGRGGLRGLFSHCPSARDLAENGAPGRLARDLLGERARAVKATLFDKTPTANWQVPIHQDQTIAVDRRVELPGFGPWCQ